MLFIIVVSLLREIMAKQSSIFSGATRFVMSLATKRQ